VSVYIYIYIYIGVLGGRRSCSLAGLGRAGLWLLVEVQQLCDIFQGSTADTFFLERKKKSEAQSYIHELPVAVGGALKGIGCTIEGPGKSHFYHPVLYS
jgi:hypothetical protein